MSLTDTVCKSAKPKLKPYKLADSQGLYLHVMPNGSKYWRIKFRYLKKEKLLAVGKYPEVTLAQARDKVRDVKNQLAENIDPSRTKKEQKRKALKDADNLFKNVAEAWMNTQKENWTPNYFNTVKTRLENDILPEIGDLPIKKVTLTDLHAAIKKIENRGALHLVKKVRQHCGQIFTYAMLLNQCDSNLALNLQRAYKTRKTKHHAAFEHEEIPEFLEKLAYNDNRFYPRTIRAVQLSLLLFVRPTELRKAKWSEIDIDKKEWKIPASAMKSRRDFIVPLSNQAIAILKKQMQETGHINTDYVFPHLSRPKEPMTDGAVRMVLYRLGFKGIMTAHGFRALARTTIREQLGVDADVIEIQLAHKPTNPLGEAYDRSKFLNQRKDMMQKWADFVDQIHFEYRQKQLNE